MISKHDIETAYRMMLKAAMDEMQIYAVAIVTDNLVEGGRHDIAMKDSIGRKLGVLDAVREGVSLASSDWTRRKERELQKLRERIGADEWT